MFKNVHIHTELYRYMILCFLATFKSSLVDKPLRPVDHTTEKWPIKASSTPEIRKKKTGRGSWEGHRELWLYQTCRVCILSTCRLKVKDADRQELQVIAANYDHLKEI